MAGRIGAAGWTFALAAGLLGLGACDQTQDRLDQFSHLSDCVAKQVSGDACEEAATALAAAPLEARALWGKRAEPVELQPASLDDLLQTESYFAVGSVIAKPKEDLVEPLVEPDTFDEAAAAPTADEPATAETPATAEPAPAVVDEPSVVLAEPAPAPPVATAPAEAAAPSPAAPTITAPSITAPAQKSLRMKPVPRLEQARKTPEVLRRELKIDPGVVEKAAREAAKETGVPVTRETVREARRAAERAIKADTQTAQQIGDEIARKTREDGAPVPKALAIRSKLKVDRAVAARERTFEKLERLGLSGVVTPGESGQMRIIIGASPTHFDPTKPEAMRAMFAPEKHGEERKCDDTVTRTQMQQDAVLATECVVKILAASGEYEYVEKDYIFTNQFIKKPKQAKPTTPTVVRVAPNDPLFGLQWDFRDNGAAAGQSPGGSGFGAFWTNAKMTGSRSVTVAVVDTGLQMSHPDIASSPNIAPGYDMVSDATMGNDGDGRDADPNDPGDKCDPSDPTASDTYHGTHVAGTIGAAGTNNKAGVAGGAWDVTIVPVRALGRCGGRLSDINDAIRWAAGTVPARDALGNEVWNKHPADIINMSIGLFGECPASMQAAINDAVAAGAVVVVAAGNARIDAKYYAPGGCDNVISVAAGDARGMLTPYSNYGEKVSIMAPGGDMTRDDDGDGRPDGILSTKMATDCYDPADPKVQVAQCYYAYENGTSMASPHVAAALALLKAKFPAAVPSELKSRLLAASSARTPLQCSGKCSNYPGSEPIAGQDGLCYRPCGGKMLNLANASLQ